LFHHSAAALVTLIAAVYVRFGSLPQVAGILYGIKPAVIAIILQALWSLARTAVKSKVLAVIGVLAVVLNGFGVSPLIVLAIAGIASGAAAWFKRQGDVSIAAIPTFGKLGLLLGTAAVAVPVSLIRLFLSFLKIGAIVFGSGYVLLAFLRAEFIDRLHWLTEKQLIDAVAVGQFTPGPVFTTATFIGYLVAGIPGALLATIGIFLPGFALVALSGRLLPRLRRSVWASATLDGVVVGSFGSDGCRRLATRKSSHCGLAYLDYSDCKRGCRAAAPSQLGLGDCWGWDDWLASALIHRRSEALGNSRLCEHARQHLAL
jgi:chromate transporter